MTHFVKEETWEQHGRNCDKIGHPWGKILTKGRKKIGNKNELDRVLQTQTICLAENY
jgi:hypothetical protein